MPQLLPGIFEVSESEPTASRAAFLVGKNCTVFIGSNLQRVKGSKVLHLDCSILMRADQTFFYSESICDKSDSLPVIEKIQHFKKNTISDLYSCKSHIVTLGRTWKTVTAPTGQNMHQESDILLCMILCYLPKCHFLSNATQSLQNQFLFETEVQIYLAARSSHHGPEMGHIVFPLYSVPWSYHLCECHSASIMRMRRAYASDIIIHRSYDNRVMMLCYSRSIMLMS